MPFDSLVAMGRRRSVAVAGLAVAPLNGRPARSVAPPAGPLRPPPATPEDDFFPGALRLREPSRRLGAVRADPGTVRLHPGWRRTALAPAIGSGGLLQLQRLRPQSFTALRPEQRQVLMGLLAGTRHHIAWRDNAGRSHCRRRILGLPLGRRFTVNGATALTLQMATVPGTAPFRLALLAGLPHVVDEIQGTRDGRAFHLTDVAWVVAQLLPTVGRGSATVPALDTLAAVGTLVRHYIAETARERPLEVGRAMHCLARAVLPQVGRQPQTLGLLLGLVLAGGHKYAASLAARDGTARWRVATAVNMVWAAQNFIPVPWVSGLTSSVAVAGGILYDYKRPPRDYADVARRFEARFLHFALGRLPAAEVAAIAIWQHMALRANDL